MSGLITSKKHTHLGRKSRKPKLLAAPVATNRVPSVQHAFEQGLSEQDGLPPEPAAKGWTAVFSLRAIGIDLSLAIKRSGG